MRAEVRKIVAEPENLVPFLVPGRIIRISVTNDSADGKETDWGWGILVNFTKQRINAKNIQQVGRQNKALASIIEQSESHYVLDVYLYVKDRLTSENTVQPGDPTIKNGRLGIVPVILDSSTVHSVSSIQIRLPNNVKQQEKHIEMMYFELLRRFEQEGKGLPLLHPIDDMEIENERL